MSLAAALQDILVRPDILPLAITTEFSVVAGASSDFSVDGTNHVALSTAAFRSGADTVTIVRHALELRWLLGLLPDEPVVAGLGAARCAALYQAIAFPPAPPKAWQATMASEVAPDLTQFRAVWQLLAHLQPGITREVSGATVARITALWPYLGPTEHLIAMGGDTRLRIDAATGLNAYGCSPRPRPWAITFASSTASSISERGYAAAEDMRRRVLRAAIDRHADQGPAIEAARIRQAIARHYDLADTVRVVLIPSGTDGELLALAAALSGEPGRPLTNLLVGPEESGSGVPLAAGGRHFSTLTASGIAVVKGDVMTGVPENLVVESVAVRTPDGLPRPAEAIAADCRAVTDSALAQGRRVLFHILDQSKTGLVAPRPADLPPHHADVDLIVDASQARLTAASLAGYLEHGAMVLLTGSKFFTGPPFAGALLVPPALAARLDDRRAWPAGFSDYFTTAPGSADEHFIEDVSLGLALRWCAAVAEMEAYADIAPAVAIRIIKHFAASVEAAVKANPDLHWQSAGLPERSGDLGAWDRLPTIFTFSVRRGTVADQARPFFDMVTARRIYTWLNGDLSSALPAGCPEDDRRLAARQVHLGQPVALSQPDGSVAGAFRLSVGARLISGEPSHRHLDLNARLDLEISDALTALEKVSLIVRYFDAIEAADPPSRFQ